jgi:hypothetical protein
MHAARTSFVVLLLFVVATTMLYSQVCDTSCALYGCSGLAEAKVIEQPEHPSHCKQHEPDPAPQKQKKSGDCSIHSSNLAFLLPVISSVASSDNYVHPAIADALFIIDYSLAVPGKIARGRSLRSPPTQGLLSVLRI